MLSRLLFSIAFIVLLARSSHQASDGQVLQQWRRTWSVVPTQVVKTWKGNDPCRAVPAWFGISCNDLYTGRKTSRVTQISLVDDEGKDVKFAGQLPARLGMLSELQYMDWIDFPRLSGTVPPSIVNLKKLAVVYFYNTGLSGKLDVLGRIPNLREFWVDTNNFSGGLPKKLPASLERIGIYNEKLSGTWPKWTKLNRLLSVEFSGLSNVKGKWPASLSKLARLDEVVFRDTGLNGRLPNAKQLPKNMRYLRLPGNKMAGASSWPVSTVAAVLTFCHVGFTDRSHLLPAGVLPKTWGAKNAMKKLVRVDLYSNTGLRGKVPRAWTRNAKMRSASLYLKPGNPRLCGVVPNKLKAFDYNSDRRMKNLGKC